jgi:hypothetical protein
LAAESALAGRSNHRLDQPGNEWPIHALTRIGARASSTRTPPSRAGPEGSEGEMTGSPREVFTDQDVEPDQASCDIACPIR